ncbi:MAG: DUF4956 domain-containing protein [Ruminococcaceae bacterium]|nr:DUF4956 domain-containing protein [Oscillospiraceae bacterium]
MNYILETIDITVITLGHALSVMGCAMGLSVAIMLVYLFTHRRTGFRPAMLFTMMLLGPIVSVIVICIGSNIARAISIGGGLALIRFRNTVEDPRDIVYYYISIAAGIACGVGFIGFGAIAVGLILVFILITSIIGLDRFGGTGKRLRVLIPESLDYDGVFEPVLKEYCRYSHLNRIKTQDYGTLLELDYRIILKDKHREKEFIDQLRQRNGNLNISLVQSGMEDM